MKLTREYYLSSNVISIAKDLIGKYLFTRFENKLTGGIITETEAYNGVIDKASHAFNGRRTARTEIMYSEGGTGYVYLCYGVHALFNVVTNDRDIPHAILIRAIFPTHGIKHMQLRKNTLLESAGKLATGPGSVTKVLGIQCEHTGINLLGNKIWLEDRGINIDREQILTGPRIGVESSGTAALLPYRFRVIHSKIIV